VETTITKPPAQQKPRWQSKKDAKSHQ